MIRLLATAAALAASLLLNAGLFSFLPLMGYWNAHRGTLIKGKSLETHPINMAAIPKKKEKPKELEPKQTQQKKTVEPGKSVARQRFVMDLGPGGGSAGGASGGGMGKGNLEQVSYAEGETDEDARPLNQVAPRKPKKAEASGAGGLVRCLLTVGEDGRVVDVQFLEVPGDYGFEDAVREALKEWRYKPAQVAGLAVRQKIEQPFRF
ncbi:MAG: energy transducer TonB [Fibrobacteria bacterium]